MTTASSVPHLHAHGAATLECQQCGAALTVHASARTAKCVYCTSPAVVARPPSPDRPDPTFVLGFVVTPERALDTAKRWIKLPWLAPEAFRRAVPSEVTGLYLPAYLYSAAAFSEYSAEIGENYTVTESYSTMENGKLVQRTRTRTETEWRGLAGRHAAYIQDRVVTASRGIPNAELEAIEPFDLRAIHRFTPRVISGWLAEEASLAQAECLQMAREEAIAVAGRMLGGFMPGDKHRGLQHRTWLEQEHLALALLPIWVLAVRYAPDKPPVRLLVNGQSGKVTGKAPRSWLKITLLVLAVLGSIGGVVLALLAMASVR